MSKNVERKRERKQTRTTGLEVSERLSVDELNDIRTRANHALLVHEGETAFIRMSGLEGFNLGFEYLRAHFRIYISSNDLLHLMTRIATAFVTLEGFPEEYRLKQLRNTYTQMTVNNLSLNQQLILLVDNLRATLKDYLPIVEVTDALVKEKIGTENLISGALRLSEAVRLLMDTNKEDKGQTLQEWMQTSDYRDIENVLQYMRDNAKNWGRTRGRTAINQYIIDKTKQLADLNGLSTRGQRIARFMQFLESYDDVKHWKENPTAALPRDASKELQAYQVFHHLDQHERTSKLREIERPPKVGGG